MGYQVDSLQKDLEDTLAEISSNEDATFRVSIKTDENNLSNIYFNKMIDEGGGVSSKSDDGDDDDDQLPNLDEMSRRKLQKFIKEHDLDVEIDQDEDDLRDDIESVWKKRSKGEEKKTAEKKKKSNDDDKIIKGLQDLCDTFGIKFNKNDDLSELKATLDGFTFKKKELDDDEVKALKDADLEELIV